MAVRDGQASAIQFRVSPSDQPVYPGEVSLEDFEPFDVRGSGRIELPDGRWLVQLGLPMGIDVASSTDEDWEGIPDACGPEMACEAAAIVLYDPTGDDARIVHGDETQVEHDNWDVLGTFQDGSELGLVAGHYILGNDEIIVTRIRANELLRQQIHHYVSGG